MRAIPDLPRRCAAELLGTFALVSVGTGAAMVAASTHAFGHIGISATFGLVVAIVVASIGHLSGAHINPAVTIGFWSVGRFPVRDVVPYVFSQCAGAIIASLLLGWLLGPIGGYGATVPAVSVARALVIEGGYSGLLAFVIMAVATDSRAAALLAPVTIGATVFAGAIVAGPLTGGSFNPARSLGPAVAGGGWPAHWMYWLGPIGGMIGGMWLYEALRGEHPTGGPPLGMEGPIDDAGQRAIDRPV